MFLPDPQIALVQTSFTPVIDNIDAASALFYDVLYELDPSLENLFRGEIYTADCTFIDTLYVLVNTLGDPIDLIATTEALGKSYVEYGVREVDYPLLGRALHAMLQQGLGADYSPEVEAAWASAYEVISSIAIAAAYPAAVDSW